MTTPTDDTRNPGPDPAPQPESDAAGVRPAANGIGTDTHSVLEHVGVATVEAATVGAGTVGAGLPANGAPETAEPPPKPPRWRHAWKPG